MDAHTIYEAVAAGLQATDPPGYRWLRKNKNVVITVIAEEIAAARGDVAVDNADADADADDELPPEDAPVSKTPIRPLTDYEVRNLGDALGIKNESLKDANVRSFYLRRTDLPKAEATAAKYGVVISVEPLTLSDVQYRLAARRTPPNTDPVLRKRIFEQCRPAAGRLHDTVGNFGDFQLGADRCGYALKLAGFFKSVNKLMEIFVSHIKVFVGESYL